MLKQLAVSGALLIGTLIPADAQQREAILQRVEIKGAPFDLLIASPKAEGVIYDLAQAPDAFLLRLAGGEMAIGFERADAMLTAFDSVQRPVASFRGEEKTPIVIYTVPKAE